MADCALLVAKLAKFDFVSACHDLDPDFVSNFVSNFRVQHTQEVIKTITRSCKYSVRSSIVCIFLQRKYRTQQRLYQHKKSGSNEEIYYPNHVLPTESGSDSREISQ